MTVEYFWTRPGARPFTAFTKSSRRFSKVLPRNVNVILSSNFLDLSIESKCGAVRTTSHNPTQHHTSLSPGHLRLNQFRHCRIGLRPTLSGSPAPHSTNQELRRDCRFCEAVQERLKIQRLRQGHAKDCPTRGIRRLTRRSAGVLVAC